MGRVSGKRGPDPKNVPPDLRYRKIGSFFPRKDSAGEHEPAEGEAGQRDGELDMEEGDAVDEEAADAVKLGPVDAQERGPADAMEEGAADAMEEGTADGSPAEGP